jgi:lathosterol oxidase
MSTGEAVFVAFIIFKQIGAFSSSATEFSHTVQHREAMAFPHHFNESWNAPNDCSLSDLAIPSQNWSLNGLTYFLIIAQSFSFLIYFSLCGTLQLHYYVNQRDRSGEWKCQPGKFLSPSQEANEILIGSFNTFTANCGSAILACYLYNGGETMLYFNVSDYGWIYFVLSIPLLFLYEEASAYYLHRLMHKPFLYKHLHKWHHHYTIPTAFSATAFHPVEWWCFQTVHFLPAFACPVHALAFVFILLYNYYYGLIDHSGVYIESIFPWQEPSLFHDYHHKYSSCNYGLNTRLFDTLHGTLREIHQWRPVKGFYPQKMCGLK